MGDDSGSFAMSSYAETTMGIRSLVGFLMDFHAIRSLIDADNFGRCLSRRMDLHAGW